MKSSVFSIAAFVALVAAQGVPNLPACGAGACMLPAISASGCGFTDSKCLCAKDSFKTALTTCVPKQCTAASDVASFYTFVNGQCAGQPGFPMSQGAVAAAPAAPAAPTSSAVAAAPKPASSTSVNHATMAMGAPTPSAAKTSGRPAQYTGAAALGYKAGAGVMALAGLAAVL